MSGIIGRFMTSFGLTMAFAILVSLVVSFTLTPTDVCSHAEGEASERRRASSHSGLEHSRVFDPWTEATRGCWSGRWRTAA
jgi:multidrug efflux pump subunit AcrB